MKGRTNLCYLATGFSRWIQSVGLPALAIEWFGPLRVIVNGNG